MKTRFDKADATLDKADATLRDYFASKVLQGIHSNHEILRCMVMDRNNCARNKEEDTIHDYIAQECYQQADAMLKEREL